AIAWHVKEVLDQKKLLKDRKIERVVFNEITKKAVTKGIENPRDIEPLLVDAYMARRALDYLVGFNISPILWTKLPGSKSAGRVQSVALKLITEREHEIELFNPKEFWTLKVNFKDNSNNIVTSNISQLEGKKVEKFSFKNKEDINDAAERIKKMKFSISDISSKIVSRNPAGPFTTSTLQQVSSGRLGLGASRTMQIAQKLYQGIEIDGETIGLITYMRTDGTNISEEAVSNFRNFIKNTYGNEYLNKDPLNYSGKKAKNAQEAHEAIRPTDIDKSPDKVKKYLSPEQHKLYDLIWSRALSSQMQSAQFDRNTITITSDNKETILKTTGSVIKFDGYLKVYKHLDKETNESKVDLSKYIVGENIISDSIYEKQLFTSPPPRYTEARLIKEMEDLGIGRPSTYAQTILTIKNRKYVVLKDKKFQPTEQGTLTIEELDKYFQQFIKPDYSKKMEVLLDEIAKGSQERVEVLNEFYQYFMPLVANASKNMSKVPPKETGESCPKCDSPMVVRNGRYGEFEACSNYPKCKHIKQNENKEKPQVFDTKVKCPECKDGTLVLRTAKKGKNKGKKFLASSNFPKCKYISPLKVEEEKCPKCSNLLVTDDKGLTYCIDPNCDYKK
ncbi:MAG: type I DNA topoisomerase, partial [Tenericutes bacterium]|nr:type I DNA topoisomerase [Mycoplasmatota bacterium]